MQWWAGVIGVFLRYVCYVYNIDYSSGVDPRTRVELQEGLSSRTPELCASGEKI